MYRNKETKRDDFVFFTNRLACLIIEYALSFLSFKVSHFPCIVIICKRRFTNVAIDFMLLYTTSVNVQDISVETMQGSPYEGKRFDGKVT